MYSYTKAHCALKNSRKWPLATKNSSIKYFCRISNQKQSENSVDVNQGRRQEFFQGRALGGSRGGLPSHFLISRGGGLNPDFWSLQWSKWKNFRARGHAPLPMPAYALVGNNDWKVEGQGGPNSEKLGVTLYCLWGCSRHPCNFVHNYNSRIK